MRERVLQRMNDEFTSYRVYLVSGALTAEQLFEEAYDTYIRETLPAVPIGSPSMDSIAAVLRPADTQDLFFVYDEEGNYYFAEDYDQHLINCQLAGIY